MRRLLTAVLTFCFLSVAYAKDDAQVTYVGGGRYVCKGDSYKCAQIDQQNQSESERRREVYQRDQDRAQSYVNRERRREEERTRQTYNR